MPILMQWQSPFLENAYKNGKKWKRKKRRERDKERKRRNRNDVN